MVTRSAIGNDLSPAPASANRPRRPGRLPHLFQKQLRDRALDRQLSAPRTPAPAQHAPGSTAPLPGLCAASLPFPPAPRRRAELPPPPASASPRPPSPDVTQGHRGPSGTASCQAWCRALSSRAERKHPGPERTSVWGTRTSPLCCRAPHRTCPQAYAPAGRGARSRGSLGLSGTPVCCGKEEACSQHPCPQGQDPAPRHHTDLDSHLPNVPEAQRRERPATPGPRLGCDGDPGQRLGAAPPAYPAPPAGRGRHGPPAPGDPLQMPPALP